MADNSFPCNLPGILLASLSNNSLDHTRRNNVQSGPPRVELLTSTVPTLFNVSWRFSLLDFQVFEGWFKYELVFGSFPFDISLPVGMGDVVHECFFNRPYTVNRTGRLVEVQATLLAIEKIHNTVCDSAMVELIHRITSDTSKCQFYNNFIIFAEESLPDSWETISYGTDFS